MKKFVNILIILVMALSSVASVTAAAPSASGVPDGKFKAEEGVPVVIGEVAGATEPARYIIFLPDEPLATYAGETAGLDATAPRETGRKLSEESGAVVAYQSYLERQQADFIAEAKATLNRSPEVLFRYQYAANGVAMILTPSEAAILAQKPGVRVFRAPIETPDTDTGPELIGAPAIWNGDTASGLSTKGEGIIVGIIDTGVNFDHPSFSATPADGFVYPVPAKYFGVCDSTNLEQYDAEYAAACNNKLIGAFTFVRGDPDESETPEDSEGHGSHTASTVAGNTVDVLYQGVATTISGVAPHAQIISFDVCVPTPPNGACYGDATVEAVDAALETGVDVINYSISGGSNPYADPVELAFLSATEAGIFVSTSAGNAGDTTGYSSVAHRSPWVSTTAAATHSRIFALQIDVAGPGTVPPELIGLGAVPSGAPLTSTITASPIKYDPANLLGCNAFSAGFFTGSVALIQRGTCNFTDKTANAYAAGATYVIIFNSRTGPPVGMPVPESSSMLSLEDGLAVKAWIDTNPTATVTIHDAVAKVNNTAWEDIIAAFSSLGPNTSFDVLKPDITGPGVNILAAVADDTITPSGDYELDLYQGTSMSSPHNAGSAALIMALHPDWTVAEIKSAMMLTAEDGLMADRSALGEGVRPATPQDEGSGRIALEITGLTGLVMDETIANYEAADPELGGDPSTLNMASLYSSQCVGTCSWTRTFTSVAGLPAAYTVNAPAWITVDPVNFMISPGATQEVTFTADVTSFTPDEWQFASIVFETDGSHPGGAPSVVLTQDFTEATFPPAGWASYDLDGSGSYWARRTDTYTSSPASARHTYSNVGYQAGWLVSPLVSIPSDGITTIDFQQRGAYTSDIVLHGLAVSTGSIDPTAGNYVYLTEIESPPEGAWTTTPVMYDLSAYAGQSVYIAFVYEGFYADAWWLDDIRILNTPAGDPISDVHIPAAVLPTTSNLPTFVEFETRRDAGGGTITDIVGAEITALTVDTYGFVKGVPTVLSLAEDPTNGEVYDDLSQVFHTIIPMTDGAIRFVAEITASTAPDVDLFWGIDWNGDGLPSEDEEEGSSATGTAFEYVSDIGFPPGFYDLWVIVQNWEGSGAPTDDITLTLGVVPYAPVDPATMTVNGPTTNPALTPFDLEVLWHGIETEPGDRLYGLFDVYDNASYDVPLGYTAVDVIRVQDDVTKTVDLVAADPGDTLTYTITVKANTTPDDLTYTINDVLPAGVTYVPGSVTGGTYDAGTNAIQWSGVMTGVGAWTYEATTSAADPNCTLGFFADGDPTDDYLDWFTTSYAFDTDPAASGDTFAYSYFGSYPDFNYYGVDYASNEFVITADGYTGIGMTSISNVNQEIPDPTGPNGVLAMFWDDFTVVYNAGLNQGVTAVGDSATLAVYEIDDIQLNADPTKTLDMEIGYILQPDNTPGAYEIIFAYDNITPGLFAAASGTIGVENEDGTAGTLFSYNDAALTIADGSAICFDWVPLLGEDHVITFQATVDAGFSGTITNEALHVTDGIGALEESAEAVTLVGNTAPVAVDDTYGVFEDGVLSEGAPGVLDNDSDENSDPLTAILVDGPSHGLLELNPDGSFTYTPEADYFGTDTFTYMANDGTDNSNIATVTITIIELIEYYLPIIIKP